MKGLVWDGHELQLTDALQVRAPAADEVKVRVLRSGICHSDINAIDGGTGTPVVLGHEAAGVVMETGAAVTGWSPGDAVVATSWTPCGECRECQRDEPINCNANWGIVPDYPFTWNDKPTIAYARIGSFASEIVVKATQLYRTHEIPSEQAALIGCAVSTGFSAVRRLGQVRNGDRVVVIGIGGIGVNAIQAARLAGATVLAVDINPAKEVTARHFGANEFLCATREQDGPALTRALMQTFAPIDVVVECSGAPVAVEAAIHSVKRGGRAVLIGMTMPGASAKIDLGTMVFGRAVVAALGGGIHPQQDVPELIELIRSRRIDVASQVSQVWPLAHAHQAIDALRAGKVTRAVLDLSL